MRQAIFMPVRKGSGYNGGCGVGSEGVTYSVMSST